jgi:hypothetical protein
MRRALRTSLFSVATALTAAVAATAPAGAVPRPLAPIIQGPATYSLTVTGTEVGGATLTCLVHYPLDFGLVVFGGVSSPPTVPPGLVRLGPLAPGLHHVHWDLRVGGTLLGPGTYVVALEIFNAGYPSGRPFPPPAIVIISAGGHDTAKMT